MGYFSRLAVELLEINRDREQEIDRTPDQPVIQQEEQFQEIKYNLSDHAFERYAQRIIKGI